MIFNQISFGSCIFLYIFILEFLFNVPKYLLCWIFICMFYKIALYLCGTVNFNARISNEFSKLQSRLNHIRNTLAVPLTIPTNEIVFDSSELWMYGVQSILPWFVRNILTDKYWQVYIVFFILYCYTKIHLDILRNKFKLVLVTPIFYFQYFER